MPCQRMKGKLHWWSHRLLGFRTRWYVNLLCVILIAHELLEKKVTTFKEEYGIPAAAINCCVSWQDLLLQVRGHDFIHHIAICEDRPTGNCQWVIPHCPHLSWDVAQSAICGPCTQESSFYASTLLGHHRWSALHITLGCWFPKEVCIDRQHSCLPPSRHPIHSTLCIAHMPCLPGNCLYSPARSVQLPTSKPGEWSPNCVPHRMRNPQHNGILHWS